MQLTTSTCLVTGANRGIGLAISQELAHRGATVVAAARDPQKMPPIEGDVTTLRLDASSRESIEEAAAAAGAVDVLVNNAGVLQAGQLEDEDVDHLYEVVQVNLAAG